MSQLTPAATRLIKTSSLAVLSTAIAAAGTMWLITGTANPWGWLSAYSHAQRCASADAALSSTCTAAMAQPAVAVHETPSPSDEPATAPTTNPPDHASAQAPAPVYSEPEDDSAGGEPADR